MSAWIYFYSISNDLCLNLSLALASFIVSQQHMRDNYQDICVCKTDSQCTSDTLTKHQLRGRSYNGNSHLSARKLLKSPTFVKVSVISLSIWNIDRSFKYGMVGCFMTQDDTFSFRNFFGLLKLQDIDSLSVLLKFQCAILNKIVFGLPWYVYNTTFSMTN